MVAADDAPIVLHTAMQSEIHRRRAEDLNVEVHDKLELAATIELIKQPLPSTWPPSAA